MAIFILVGVCPVVSVSANTTGVTKDGFVYEIDNEEVEITDYVSDEPKVKIPSSIEGYPVTSIGANAFRSVISAPRFITEVTIPDTVTSIGVYAFSGIKIKSIIIPDSVTDISAFAFYSSQLLDSITLPKSVKHIGESAFRSTGYYNTKENWQDDVLYIDSALISAKESVSGELKIKDGTTVIADRAFDGCELLGSVTIPQGVTSIGEYIFYDCKALESVTIPKGVKNIGTFAFANCSSLKKVDIPDGVIDIGEHAFSWCSSLERVTMPESVTSIGASAFSVCSSLDEVIIPSGVTNINETAFSACASLKSIVIPKGVTSIGDRAFLSCTSLADITIPESVITIGIDAFGDTAYYSNTDNWQDGVLYIDKALIGIESYTFNKINEYNIKDGTNVIADYAFYNGRTLEKLTIPSTVKSIGYKAFGGCRALNNIAIPESVIYIGSWTFASCDSLTDVFYEGSQFQWDRAVGDEYKTGLRRTINIHYAKENTYVLGDANCDDNVNVRDATLIQKAVASLVTLDDIQNLAADTDLSGEVNVKDATVIQKWAAGITVDFPIGDVKN